MEKKRFFDLGYKRSNKKPHLFWKPFGRVRLFIDLRDPFWKIFYFYPCSNLTPEEEQEYQPKIIKEFKEVNKNKFGDKLDFPDLSYCIQCDGEFIFPHAKFEYGDVCSKGCSILLRKDNAKNDKKQVRGWKETRCSICKKFPVLEDKKFPIYYLDGGHVHHTDYRKGKEKTIKICASCHAKITLHPDKHPDLKEFQPVGTRKEFLEKKKKYCVDCEKLLEGRQLKFCLDCKREKAQEEERKKLAKKNRWRTNSKKQISPMIHAYETLQKDKI